MTYVIYKLQKLIVCVCMYVFNVCMYVYMYAISTIFASDVVSQHNKIGGINFGTALVCIHALHAITHVLAPRSLQVLPCVQQVCKPHSFTSHTS